MLFILAWLVIVWDGFYWHAHTSKLVSGFRLSQCWTYRFHTIVGINRIYVRRYQPDLCLTYFFDLRREQGAWREQGACSSERSRSSVTKSSVRARACVCICVVLCVRVRRVSLSCVFAAWVFLVCLWLSPQVFCRLEGCGLDWLIFR